MEYFQLSEINDLPSIGQYAPFKAVLAVENPVSHGRQLAVSKWLVEMGCKYVMICGESPDNWEQTIRQANLDRMDLENLKPEEFVMITVHKYEKLRNVFWHAKKFAHHSHVTFANTLTIHISNQNRSVEYQAIHAKA